MLGFVDSIHCFLFDTLIELPLSLLEGHSLFRHFFQIVAGQFDRFIEAQAITLTIIAACSMLVHSVNFKNIITFVDLSLNTTFI